MKQFIISADDFGLARPINSGIIEAYKQGFVTSISLMANMPAWGHAIKLLKESPELDIGVHLNIIRGFPLGKRKEVACLLNKKHMFLGFSKLVRKLVFSQIKLSEVEHEFSLQIERVLGEGFSISHLDTEKHIHAFPAIGKIVVRLAKKYKIGWVRGFRQTNSFSAAPYGILNKEFFKNITLWGMASFWKKLIRQEKLKAAKFFYTIPSSGGTGQLCNIFNRIAQESKAGVSEIVFHPGFHTEELEENKETIGSFNISNWEEQVAVLKSEKAKKAIRDNDITLIKRGL